MKKTKETKCQKSSNNTVKSSKLSFVFRPFSFILSVLRRLEFLGLYSYLKIQPSLGRRSSSFHSIKRLAKLRTFSYISVIILLFLTVDTIIPIYIKHTLAEAESGVAKQSTLTYNAANTTASVKLNVTSKDGTFATSDENEKIKFTLSTNNATGYTLSIRAASNMDKVTLSNGSDGVIEPLPATSGNGVSATTYASSGSAGQAYNNTWGYIPNYYHSSANTNTYYRAPNTTTGETLRKTNTANSSNGIDNADSYSIGLGIRANYAKASGTYTSDNVLVLEYVANPVAYSISYADNTGDTVGSWPSNTGSQSTSATTIKLSSTIPTRTGYTFSKWCLGTVSNNGTTCTGTLFDAGGDFGIDQTISPNSATLYAVWTIKTYTITIARNNTSYGTVSSYNLSLPYGTTLPTSGTTSTSITLGDTTVTATPTTQTSQYVYNFTNWTHSCGAAVINNCTITANFARANVYTITWNPNNGSVSPTTTTRISGEQIGELPTPTRDGYDFLGWFTSASGGTQISSTTTVTGNKTYYAHWEKVNPFNTAFANAGKSKQNGYYAMQDMTASICSAITTPTTKAEDISTQLIDTRDNKVYWVSKLKDGHCWMTQNLDYDIKASGNEVAVIGGTTTTWNSTYPAHATETTLSSHANATDTYSWDPGDYYVANGGSSSACTTWRPTSDCESTKATVSLTSADAKGNTNLHYHLGNYYQWNTATAGYGGTETNTDYSICPKGWRLPTSNSYTDNYSFGALTNAYGIADGKTDAALRSSPLRFVRAGRVGYGSLGNQGTNGFVWSSRALSDAYNAYLLSFYSARVYSSNTFGRDYGNSVRCVAE